MLRSIARLFSRKTLASVAVVGVAALAFGCSNDDDGASAGGSEGFVVQASTTMTASPAVAKPAFLAQVGRICRHGWKEVLENYAEYSSWQSPKLTDKQLFTQVVRSSFLAGFDFHVFDAIRQIKAPKGEKEAVEAVIGELQEAVERGQRVTRVTTVAELNRLFADYNRAAARYGLDRECTVDGARLVAVQADRQSRRINHIPSQ